jgi:hypothetical protein
VTPERLTESERDAIGTDLVSTARHLELTMNWGAAVDEAAG